MAASSATSLQTHSSCFVSCRSNQIKTQKTLLDLGSGVSENPTRWESLRLPSAGQRKTEREATEKTKGKQRGGAVAPARCAAEGIMIGGGEANAEAKTPERVKVVALTALMMCLCNADRVVMSVAVVPLADKLGWSSSFLGVVQSSFLWGYMLSSVMGGALVDRYGGKRVLGWGVGLWSLATLLTPWSASHSTLALLLVRAFFGLAEGVALPSMTTLLSRWFPTGERASAVGISMAGFHMGNVVGLILTPIMLSSIGLTGPFILFASLGLLWLSSWSYSVTNHPRDSPFISRSELRLIQAGKHVHSTAEAKPRPLSLRLLLSKLPTWAIIFANVTNNWGYFVLLSWMPVYFKTVFNVNLKQAAWFSALPENLYKVCERTGYSLTIVRKIMQSIGFIGPGISLLCLNFAKSPSIAAIFITIALSLSSFSQAGFLLNIQDIAPEHAGFLHGISNSAGTMAAIVSTIGTGYFVEWLGSFEAFLTVTAALYFASTLFWLLFSTGERVF
ncbi:PREDICTED: probable anion transporter 3, chloroplastic [Tarenaya hassleriana]|uniref:probable anion transporter 3, chloroplastic n=1 Tax=Tarenaya hassleriana TaxID=28532 RepID=UPI00053CAA32|nr:PREDICTED: probable anion transporter 3, chloroplastic [Tarenaya hassleriana]